MKKCNTKYGKIVLKDSVIVKLYDANHNYWELMQPIKIIAFNKYYQIPKNFVTDFATIPKILKPFVPNKFIYNQIVVLHDFLYFTHKVSRKKADLILKEGIKCLGNNSFISKIYSNVFYYAVRIFGKYHW